MRTSVYGWYGAAVLMLLAGCAAERLHRQGLAAIDRGEYEAGVAQLHQALEQDPGNIAYRLDYEARRDGSVQKLIGLADSARGMGHFDTATALYQRVLTIDPSNVRAQRGLTTIEADQRHAAAMTLARQDFERKDYTAAEAKLHTILSEDATYRPAQELTAAVNAARGPANVAPRLKTRDNRKVSLQLRDAPTKMAFEVLQRETGINFILDKDIKADGKTTIFVQDVPVDEAIDLVLDQNGLARQILASNMVLIYPNNPTKAKEYEQQIVRTFYINNAEPKEVESMLKAVLGAKNMFIDDRSASVTLRDTPDAVRMAEKLVASLDVSEPEVMLEVEVLEVGSSRLLELGIRFPDSLALSLVGAAGTAGTITLTEWLNRSSDLVQLSFTNPLFLFQLRQQDGATSVLANPRIRVKNKEKARIHIGDRVPVITTTAAATGGFVSESVNYLDVGLKLEVEPLVYLEDEVGIKVALEVSNIAREIRTAGSNTLTYQIGTRNAATTLRLRDGETQILAGLISDEERKSASRVPGLGDLPIIGRLFSQTRDNIVKTEIVLLITPRVVRTLARPEVRAVEFSAGTEASGGAGAFGSSVPPPAQVPSQPQPQPSPEKPAAAPGGQPQGNTMVPFGGVQQPR